MTPTEINTLFLEKIRKINKQGYILIYVPEHPNSNSQGYYLEHRYAVELFIGRILTKKEVIHHLNSDKLDNCIENLMLFKSQKEHKSFENKIRQFGLTNPIKRQISERWNSYLVSNIPYH